MNIETVKEKFESDLSELKKIAKKLDGILDRDIMGTLEEVVAEYENSFVYHIDELISKNESLQKRVEEMKQNN